MHFGTDIDDITVILLLLQNLFYIGNRYIQCNTLIYDTRSAKIMTILVIIIIIITKHLLIAL